MASRRVESEATEVCTGGGGSEVSETASSEAAAASTEASSERSLQLAAAVGQLQLLLYILASSHLHLLPGGSTVLPREHGQEHRAP